MADAIYERKLGPIDKSFFLFGARGTGKRTWARRHYGDALWVDLLDESRCQELLAEPSLLAAELRAAAQGSWVVVDGVQQFPALLNEVHRFIEQRGMRFVLLGSSARKLRTAGANLLAGRPVRRELFPLLPSELGADFDLERILRFGSIASVWTSPDAHKTLESYVQLYVREEVRGEALVRNLSGFLRFLPIAALFHAQVVNVSAIARDAGTARMTVAGHLDILEDTLLTTRVAAYEAKLRVRERRHPKLYWLDPGLVRAVKRQLGPVTAEERGPLLEGWVLGLLRAHAQLAHVYDEIHYWAPAQGAVEVDFLLRRDRDLLAIEVKSARRFSASLVRGLRAVADLGRLTRRVLVYRGDRRLTTDDGIDVLPVDEFVRELETGALWR